MRSPANALTFLLLVLSFGCSTEPRTAPTAEVPATADANRGRLLYDTTCAACHSEQAHWREKRLVHDWPSLVYQVTRWQKNAGAQWRAEEVIDVAAYLNSRFYHVPCPVTGCLGALPQANLGRDPISTEMGSVPN